MSVKFYDENANKFFNDTVNADMSVIYKIFEDNLFIKTGEILDLGCGSGRDSKYFKDRGYTITAIDLSPILAKKASKYIEQEVIVEDMRNLNYQEKFIGIWACASLLHLTENEILETIKKCHRAMKKDGILYMSFKYGEQNFEKDGRKFSCFTRKKILTLIEGLGLECKSIFKTNDVRIGRGNEKWINIFMKKI